MSRFFRRAPQVAQGTDTPDSSSAPSPSRGSSSNPASNLPSPPSSVSLDNAAEQPKKHTNLILRPHPTESSVPPRPEPSEDEKPVLARLRAFAEDLIQSHYYDAQGKPRPENTDSTKGPIVEPYYEAWERRWLDMEGKDGDWTVRRYLKAGSGNEAEAKKRLESTLLWRRSFKPDLIKPDYVRVEAETGKHILSGFDKQGRSLLYLMPGRENTKSSPRQIAAITWWLERAVDVLPADQGKITLIIDFYRANQGNTPNLATSREVLDIVQKHYPERLGMAVVVNSPWWMNALFTALSPFIDPVTKSKIQWNPQPEDFCNLVPKDHLQKPYGGTYDFVFDKDSYWEQIVDWCGIKSDGTRAHESMSKVTPEEEDQLRQARRSRTDAEAEAA